MSSECQGHADCDEGESLDRCGAADITDEEQSKCPNRGCVRALLFILDNFMEQEGFGSQGSENFVGGSSSRRSLSRCKDVKQVLLAFGRYFIR